jgi:hypothetical protein
MNLHPVHSPQAAFLSRAFARFSPTHFADVGVVRGHG